MPTNTHKSKNIQQQQHKPSQKMFKNFWRKFFFSSFFLFYFVRFKPASRFKTYVKTFLSVSFESWINTIITVQPTYHHHNHDHLQLHHHRCRCRRDRTARYLKTIQPPYHFVIVIVIVIQQNHHYHFNFNGIFIFLVAW